MKTHKNVKITIGGIDCGTTTVVISSKVKIPKCMSDKAFDSMVKRNAMTDQKIEALAKSLERNTAK